MRLADPPGAQAAVRSAHAERTRDDRKQRVRVLPRRPPLGYSRAFSSAVVQPRASAAWRKQVSPARAPGAAGQAGRGSAERRGAGWTGECGGRGRRCCRGDGAVGIGYSCESMQRFAPRSTRWMPRVISWRPARGSSRQSPAGSPGPRRYCSLVEESPAPAVVAAVRHSAPGVLQVRQVGLRRAAGPCRDRQRP